MHFRSVVELQEKYVNVKVIGGYEALRGHNAYFANVSMIEYSDEEEIIDYIQPPPDKEILCKLLNNPHLLIVRTTNKTIPHLPGYITFPMYIGGDKNNPRINPDMLFTAIIPRKEYQDQLCPTPTISSRKSPANSTSIVYNCIHNIDGIEKDKLLLALYDCANCQGYTDINERAMKLFEHSQKPNGSVSIAKQLIKTGQTIFDVIDLGSGDRMIQINIEASEVDFTKYETLHGKGKVAILIEKLRHKPKSKSKKCVIC